MWFYNALLGYAQLLQKNYSKNKFEASIKPSSSRPECNAPSTPPINPATVSSSSHRRNARFPNRFQTGAPWAGYRTRAAARVSGDTSGGNPNRTENVRAAWRTGNGISVRTGRVSYVLYYNHWKTVAVCGARPEADVNRRVKGLFDIAHRRGAAPPIRTDAQAGDVFCFGGFSRPRRAGLPHRNNGRVPGGRLSNYDNRPM